MDRSTSASQDHSPLACMPSALAANQRAAHHDDADRLFHTAVQERIDLPDGLAVRCAATDYDLVMTFVAQERRCCPFFHFVIEITPNHGPIWLRITGAEGTKAVLEAGLEALREVCAPDSVENGPGV
ncbi:hypothetical protein [Herpetosiphon sp. NSE202]|uniref:hypothetical protein n=1 Tax=Herpetosiphon sp. NSE202 TaxID=3351349 RepID=UPI00364539F8